MSTANHDPAATAPGAQRSGVSKRAASATNAGLAPAARVRRDGVREPVRALVGLRAGYVGERSRLIRIRFSDVE